MLTSKQTPDHTKKAERWWHVIGCVLSKLRAKPSYSEETRVYDDQSFRSFVPPLFGPTTPVEIGWALKPTGEISTKYAIGSPTASGGPLIPTPQNFATFQDLFISGQRPGFDPSWSRESIEPLLHLSRSFPRDFQRAHSSNSIRALRPRPLPNPPTFLRRTRTLFHLALPSGDTLDVIRGTMDRTSLSLASSYLDAGTMDTTESPRMAFHPQRTDTSKVSASSSPIVILYNGLRVVDASMAESVSNIRSFMHSSSRIAAARCLRGEEAQGLIDLIDQVSDIQFQRGDPRGIEYWMQVLTLPELDANLRKQCLHLLYKVCKTSELLPASYILRQELICIGNIRRYGGFADVSDGKYLERRVAIKCLRFGTEDASNKIFRVFDL